MAVEVVRRAIDRVNDPPNSCRAAAVRSFFAEHGIVGARFGQPPENERFRSFVHLGHHVGTGGLCVDHRASARQAFDNECGCVGSSRRGELEKFSGVDSHQRTRGTFRVVALDFAAAAAASSRARIVFHSPIARSVSTTTTAVPRAATTAPISAPSPAQIEESPVT